jgi:hypothetical protein
MLHGVSHPFFRYLNSEEVTTIWHSWSDDIKYTAYAGHSCLMLLRTTLFALNFTNSTTIPETQIEVLLQSTGRYPTARLVGTLINSYGEEMLYSTLFHSALCFSGACCIFTVSCCGYGAEHPSVLWNSLCTIQSSAYMWQPWLSRWCAGTLVQFLDVIRVFIPVCLIWWANFNS